MPDLLGRLGGAGSLGETPLLVLSSGRCDLKAGSGGLDVDRHWRLMKDAQAELTGLSSRSRLVLLPDSGHAVPLENPEAVVEAIRAMVGGRAIGG
ncbi:MAG TPA: hypothetical protein VD969_20165 [Symbiobacteriaceae bacterium]|nr:hypothetical protein [Symbiobacteriaceae bacterium]